MDFKFFVTSVPGWGYALIWHMGGAYPYMGTPQRRGFLGCIKLITPYYYHSIASRGGGGGGGVSLSEVTHSSSYISIFYSDKKFFSYSGIQTKTKKQYKIKYKTKYTIRYNIQIYNKKKGNDFFLNP